MALRAFHSTFPDAPEVLGIWILCFWWILRIRSVDWHCIGTLFMDRMGYPTYFFGHFFRRWERDSSCVGCPVRPVSSPMSPLFLGPTLCALGHCFPSCHDDSRHCISWLLLSLSSDTVRLRPDFFQNCKSSGQKPYLTNIPITWEYWTTRTPN